MENQYLILATGEDKDETGVIFIKAESEREALNKFMFEHQDFDEETLEDELPMINSMMEDNPIGITELESFEDFENPSLNWYYSFDE